MNDQERGELHRIIVTTCCEVLRDSNDPGIRADVFNVLRQLKGIHPAWAALSGQVLSAFKRALVSALRSG
jgi:hypothetical protein